MLTKMRFKRSCEREKGQVLKESIRMKEGKRRLHYLDGHDGRLDSVHSLFGRKQSLGVIVQVELHLLVLVNVSDI